MENYEQQDQHDDGYYIPRNQNIVNHGPAIARDPDFMNNMFSFKEEVIGPLIHIWRGEEEVSPGEWETRDKSNNLAIMNNKGITWCSSFIASFINSVYIVSNYDEQNMNYTMRRVTRVVWNSLCKRYNEFDLRPIDIPRVAVEIWSKVHAILLGARGDGFRKFFTSTHHIDEVKSTSTSNDNTQQRGWGLFNKRR